MGISWNSIWLPGFRDIINWISVYFWPYEAMRITILNKRFLTAQETSDGFPHMARNISSISQMGILRNLIWIPGLRDMIVWISTYIWHVTAAHTCIFNKVFLSPHSFPEGVPHMDGNISPRSQMGLWQNSILVLVTKVIAGFVTRHLLPPKKYSWGFIFLTRLWVNHTKPMVMGQPHKTLLFNVIMVSCWHKWNDGGPSFSKGGGMIRI